MWARLVLGTVIDTYMEEAQEELRSKRVKQSKGAVGLVCAHVVPFSGVVLFQMYCCNSQVDGIQPGVLGKGVRNGVVV